jgi:hypothetical protein
MSTFLTGDDVATLTGCKFKSRQIEVLRRMGLPFFANAIGKPIVPAVAVEGRKYEPQIKVWMPAR